MKSLIRYLIHAFACIVLPLSMAAHSEEQTWKVNLKDADIRAFVTQIADITGYSFVIDPRIKGKVTVLLSAKTALDSRERSTSANKG